MRIALIAAAALALACARLCATDYYIDYNDGDDARDGTSATSAWKHCPGDPAATGRAALVALAPGDEVRFKGGVTYLLTIAPGIELRWDGAGGAPIVYDGNRDGSWGTGRARLSDGHGGNGVRGFVATGPRRELVFTTLEFGAIGGAASPPADLGQAVTAPRFGGGIALRGGGENVRVERCAFRELGYWFNQRPLSATAIAGAGIESGSARGLRVVDCAFSRVATACDFSGAGTLEDVRIERCVFGEAIVWPVDLPAALRLAGAADIKVKQCEVVSDATFARAAWSGYGEAPQTTLSVAGVDGSVTWTAAAMGTPEPQFQWRKNGVPLAGATASTLRLERLGLLDAGVYTVVATNAAGSEVSNAALLVVLPQYLMGIAGLLTGSGGVVTPPPAPVNVAPEITLQPVSQMVTARESVTLSAAATGVPAPTWQWRKNGAALAGATTATLALSGVTTNDSGEYVAVATNLAGTAMTAAAKVSVLEAAGVAPTAPSGTTPTLEAPVGSGGTKVLAATLVPVSGAGAVVEFAVAGTTPRAVLVRAVGPTLGVFHIVGALADPRLEVWRGETMLAANDNWGGDAAVRSAAGAVTAFPIADAMSADAAVVVTLAPGSYRVAVGAGSGLSAGAIGLVWVDAYELP